MLRAFRALRILRLLRLLKLQRLVNIAYDFISSISVRRWMRDDDGIGHLRHGFYAKIYEAIVFP
jgi:hypothetical protein